MEEKIVNGGSEPDTMHFLIEVHIPHCLWTILAKNSNEVGGASDGSVFSKMIFVHGSEVLTV